MFFNKINIFLKNYYSVLSTVLIFCCLLALLLNINSEIAFFLDDLTVVFRNPYDFYNFWLKPDHGSYITCLPNQIFGFYLPDFYFLGHPQDFLQKYGIGIRCFLFLLLPFFATQFNMFFHNNKNFFPFVFLFMFLLCFNALNFDLLELSMSTAFFRLTFPIILWVVFWLYFASYYLKNKKISKVFLLYSALLAFVMASSSETMAFVSGFSFLFLFVFNFVKKEISFNKTKGKNNRILYYIPCIFVCLGFLFLFFNQEFIAQLHIKNQRFPDVTIISTIPLFFEFLKEYIYQVFCRHIIPLLIILISCVLVFSFKNKRYDNAIIFTFSLLFGFLMFFFALFFMGRTHYSGGFWLKHPDLQYTFETALIIIASIPCGILFKEFLNKNIFKSLFEGLFIIFLMIFVIVSTTVIFKSTVKTYKEKTSTIKTYMYMYDKMTLFYWLKGQDAIIPYNFEFSNVGSYFLENKLVREFEYDESDLFHKCYIMSVYPMVKHFNYSFTFSNKAYELFLQNGGIFYEEELKNIKFERLRDFVFVVNKKKIPFNNERERATE